MFDKFTIQEGSYVTEIDLELCIKQLSLKIANKDILLSNSEKIIDRIKYYD